MMQGLLDFAKSPAGVGLLSAVAGGLAGARRGAPLNTLGAAGLAGLAGYNSASAIQEDQLKRAQSEKVREAIPTLYKQGPDGSMKFDSMAALQLGIDPKAIADYASVPNAGRAKVARTQEVMGPNGMKQIVQLDDYGQQVGGGLDGYVAPQMVDTGDRKMFVTPAAGQSFDVGLSPDQVLANQRGMASLALRDQNNRILAEANDINRMAARTQIVSGADGTQYLVDKGTGEARPATNQQGAPVKAGQAAEDANKRVRDANDSVELIKIARETLPGATGSGIGAAADTTGRFFGLTSDSAQKAAQLEALGGALVMKMPRMEGPQSNLDQLLYREMAGKIGDRTVPIAEREAALQTVEQLLGKYATNRPQEQPKAAAGAFADPDKEARYQEWKRSQGVQ
jgi:hypothetical protein